MDGSEKNGSWDLEVEGFTVQGGEKCKMLLRTEPRERCMARKDVANEQGWSEVLESGCWVFVGVWWFEVRR